MGDSYHQTWYLDTSFVEDDWTCIIWSKEQIFFLENEHISWRHFMVYDAIRMLVELCWTVVRKPLDGWVLYQIRSGRWIYIYTVYTIGRMKDYIARTAQTVEADVPKDH